MKMTSYNKSKIDSQLNAGLATTPKCSNPNCSRDASEYCEDCGHVFCKEHDKH